MRHFGRTHPEGRGLASITEVALEHHVWANLRLLDLCAELDADQLEARVPGVYGTLIDTLRHIVGGDASYLALLTDGEVAPIDESSMDIAELREVAASHHDAWRALATGTRDPDEDHRSQVCTILPSLGIEPPELDVWNWAWEQDLLTDTEPTAPTEPTE